MLYASVSICVGGGVHEQHGCASRDHKSHHCSKTPAVGENTGHIFLHRRPGVRARASDFRDGKFRQSPRILCLLNRPFTMGSITGVDNRFRYRAIFDGISHQETGTIGRKGRNGCETDTRRGMAAANGDGARYRLAIHFRVGRLRPGLGSERSLPRACYSAGSNAASLGLDHDEWVLAGELCLNAWG